MKALTTIIIVCTLASTGIIPASPHEAHHAAINPNRIINESTEKEGRYIGRALYDSYLILRGSTRLCLEQVVYSLILDCGDIIFTPTELIDKSTSQRTPLTITEIRGGDSHWEGGSSELHNTIIEGYLQDTNDDIKVVIARSCSVFDTICSDLRI